MIVEERIATFVGDRMDGTRAPSQELDEDIDYAAIDAGMLGLSLAGSSTLKSLDEHFRIKNALVNLVWNTHGSR